MQVDEIYAIQEHDVFPRKYHHLGANVAPTRRQLGLTWGQLGATPGQLEADWGQKKLKGMLGIKLGHRS